MSTESELYYWHGLTQQGNKVCGADTSNSSVELKIHIYQQGITLLGLSRQHSFLSGYHRWRHLKFIGLFLQQLAAILKSGLDIKKALNILKQAQNDKELIFFIEHLKRRLNQGDNISSIMALHPRLYDQICISLTQSGEYSGQLELSLDRAAQYCLAKQARINQLFSALLYPLVLLIITFCVLFILLYFVIPQFDAVYQQAGNQLPKLTLFILNLSLWLREELPLALLSLGIFTCALVALQKTPYALKLNHLPLFNSAYKKVLTARLCQTLSQLYNAGLPISQCLTICQSLSLNNEYQRVITQTQQHIQQGLCLSAALAKTNYFEPLFIQLIKSGEESASLNIMLEQAHTYYDQSINAQFERIKTILEPLMIVILGALIGIILVAMYLPVFNLGNSF